jgi:hypothetical protein
LEGELDPERTHTRVPNLVMPMFDDEPDIDEQIANMKKQLSGLADVVDPVPATFTVRKIEE